MRALKKAGDDPKYVEAQWDAILDSKEGYLGASFQLVKDHADPPAPLALAMVYDHSLNCGLDGPDGTRALLKKIGDKKPVRRVHEFVKEFTRARMAIKNLNNYASCKANFLNRAKMFETLVECPDLKHCDAAMKKAMAWELK